MSSMTKTFLIFLSLFFYSIAARTQNLNDDCENATDITSEMFSSNEFRMCNTVNGSVHAGWGSNVDRFEHATVDALHYNSENCIGYTSSTTDEYPDLWYKSSLHSEGNMLQQVYLLVYDTIQMAVYIGKCGQLYQSQCFTLTPMDSLLWIGLSLENIPHDVNDQIYIQLKMPPGSTSGFNMCFSDMLVADSYYFSYGRPAITKESSDMIYGKPGWKRINVSPKMAKEEIMIRSDDPVISYDIIDMLGRTRIVGNEKGYTLKQSLEKLPDGVYVLKAKSVHGLAVRKFGHFGHW